MRLQPGAQLQSEYPIATSINLQIVRETYGLLPKGLTLPKDSVGDSRVDVPVVSNFLHRECIAGQKGPRLLRLSTHCAYGSADRH